MSTEEFKGGFAFMRNNGKGDIPEEVKTALIEQMRAQAIRAGSDGKAHPNTIRALAKAVGTDDFPLIAKANAMAQGANRKDDYNAAKLRLRKDEASELDRKVIQIYEATDRTVSNNRDAPPDTITDPIVQSWPEISEQYRQAKREKDQCDPFPVWLADWLEDNFDKRLSPDAIKKRLQRLKLRTPKA